MDRRVSSELDWQNNQGISTREEGFYSILCSSSCRGHDPTSRISLVLLSLVWCQHPLWGALLLLTDDGSGTCFWNEAFSGRPFANDAWAPHGEASWGDLPLSQENLTRKIGRDGSLSIFVVGQKWTNKKQFSFVLWNGKIKLSTVFVRKKKVLMQLSEL